MRWPQGSTDGTDFYYAIPSEVHAHNHRRCALHCTQLIVLGCEGSQVPESVSDVNTECVQLSLSVHG
jgi:hypothetical protein